MDLSKYKTSDLLPHADPMVLIDELIDWTPTSAVTLVEIKESSQFYIPSKGIPAHLGIEYMAQSCGTYSGLNFIKNNQPICMGFLLGTRNFHSEIEWFQKGDKLVISISEVLRQDAMGVFDCKIQRDGKEIANAQLTVYQSNDIVNT